MYIWIIYGILWIHINLWIIWYVIHVCIYMVIFMVCFYLGFLCVQMNGWNHDGTMKIYDMIINGIDMD